MSNQDVRPSAMTKYMERHNQSFASMSKSARRVKIELNHTWRLRLLPVQMGDEKEPFVEIAQHWWNKSPITCPKHTGQAWGGDPDFPCPVCELSERLNDSSDERISGIGYKIRCSLRIRSWCVVFDMEDQRGNVDDLPVSEILNPYEFDMFKTTWESFAKYQKWATSRRRAGQEPSEWGILDLETGCDLLATQTAKGTALDRCDPGPIFPLDDPNYDEYVAKIFSRCRKPQIVIPTEKQLLEVAVKIEEYVDRGDSGGRGNRDFRRGRNDHDDERGRGGRGGRGNRRFQEDEDYDSEAEDRGSSLRNRSRFGSTGGTESEDSEASAPPRRRAPAQEESSAPPPRRSSANVSAQTQRADNRAESEEEEAPAPPPRRSAAPAKQQPQQRQDEVVTEEDLAEDQSPAPAPPPPARRNTAPAAPPPARRTAAAASNDSDTDGDTAPQRPPPRRSAAPAESGVDEEEDNVPEEREDPAPPRKEKVADDAPPPVSAEAPSPKRSVGNSSDIKDRLARLTAKGR